MNAAGGYVLFEVIRRVFGLTGVGWVLVISSSVALCYHVFKGPSDPRLGAEPRPPEVPRRFKIACYSLTLALGFGVVVWNSMDAPLRLRRFGKDLRFEKELPSYIALIPVLPPEHSVPTTVYQFPFHEHNLPQPASVTGKVKGKMVVVNVNERTMDDLHFALPDDLSASKSEEVATVVLLTWEKSETSPSGLRYIMTCRVRVFDWKSKSEIASRTVFGDPPDHLRPGTGPQPDAQVLRFLTDLPRQ
jgi:hypothetical protein